VSSHSLIQAKASLFNWQRALILGILALVVMGLWIWGGRRAMQRTQSGGREQQDAHD